MKLELSEQEINLVLSALAELPYRMSAQLIDKIKEQAELQLIDSEK